MKKAFCIVGGIFFALVALVLFTGLYLGYPVLGINTPTPFGVNLLGFIVTAVLSFWLFYAAKAN